jgi:hypothetical protein
MQTSYHPTAVRFQRQNNNYLLTGPLSGAGSVSQKNGVFSVWLRFTAGDGQTQQIVQSSNVGGLLVAGITRAANNKLNFNLPDCLDGPVLNMSTKGTYTIENGWIHVLAVWDVSAGRASIFVNGVEDTNVSVILNSDICYTALEWGVGGLSAQLDADVADFYAELGAYLDVTDPAVRAKFIQNNKPVKLGENCANPTGTTPIACFKGPVESWNVNLGTGGGMTASVPLTAAPSNPGD